MSMLQAKLVTEKDGELSKSTDEFGRRDTARKNNCSNVWSD